MSSGGRKSLVWDIRKSLLTLTAEELLRVARAVNPVSDVDQSELVERDQEECDDHINSFMYSKQLLETEDEGMVQLLMLKDTIDDIVKCREVMSFLNVKGDSELHTGQSGDKFDDLVDFAEGSVAIRTPPEITTDTHPQSRHTPTLVSTALPSGMWLLHDRRHQHRARGDADLVEFSVRSRIILRMWLLHDRRHQHRARGDADGPLVFVKWMDTREVSVCSTIHSAHSGDSVQRRVKSQGTCPAPVTAYNKHMGGVDLSDQLIQYYTTQHKTMKWYRKIFLHFLDIAATNSFILHKELHGNMSHKEFMEQLVTELCGVSQKAAPKRTSSDHVPVPGAELTSDGRNVATVGRRSCVHCKERQKQPQQRVNSADKDGISDTDDEDEWTGGYWLRTPVVRMGNYQVGHDRSVSSAREQSPVSKSSPTTVPGLTPKKPTMTHKECPGTLPMRETELTDAYLPDGRETPERDNTHTEHSYQRIIYISASGDLVGTRYKCITD
ncbi:PiggyBac transposable element-derived protein 4 [Anabarilius grahami]|uniref:PiggyBac transposable element-derived protein 4 n=1 Tax=Anabarilius grahami TaxID=495550 RepID=A0A3N0XUW3_ANAGA|nr:PiggyBac transposable element-derived protein 4 [Anabarilius grahami]